MTYSAAAAAGIKTIDKLETISVVVKKDIYPKKTGGFKSGFLLSF